MTSKSQHFHRRITDLNGILSQEFTQDLSILLRIVKNNSQSISASGANRADSMAEMRPVVAARAADRAMVDGEGHCVALVRSKDFDAGLPARLLLRALARRRERNPGFLFSTILYKTTELMNSSASDSHYRMLRSCATSQPLLTGGFVHGRSKLSSQRRFARLISSCRFIVI